MKINKQGGKMKVVEIKINENLGTKL